MSLPTPTLDDRTFQQLVDEAIKRIPQHCEEWTDHNSSDPGITLIELFSWLTEMTLYRLNQVPRLHFIKLMEMMGIRLMGPVAAEVPIAFWLTAPQAHPVTLHHGTEVASTQTEQERPIIFSTSDDFTVHPPALTHLLSRIATDTSGQSQYVVHDLRRLSLGYEEGVSIFSPVPQIEDAFYLGFENDPSNLILGIDLDCDIAGGAGIDPTLPPLVWEAATGLEHQRWQECEVDVDSTSGLNVPGRVRIHLPAMRLYRVNGDACYWVRVRVKEISVSEQTEGMQPYESTPIIHRVEAGAWGGTVMATHAQYVYNEPVGRSDGLPGQQYTLRNVPVLSRQEGEYLFTQERGRNPQPWMEVADFADSTPSDYHYTLDSVTGELHFGPAIRQPDGSIRRFGQIPPRGANIVFRQYRSGGGTKGNVDSYVLDTLKSAVPYISRVANLQPASGGRDAESLDAAMMRVPSTLRARSRAVTEGDFEYLAMQALPDAIARVRCLQARSADKSQVNAGQVYVLVVPTVRHAAGYLAPDELRMADDDLRRLRSYLDEYRLLTTRLLVRTPVYRWVSVRVRLGAAPNIDLERLEERILNRLYEFLNPLTGGVDGKGWPFGRDLFVGDVYQALKDMPYILYTRSVEIYAATPNGQGRGEPQERIDVVAHGVIVSGIHTVEFV